ncbi:MAG: hypothetical protein Kow0092_04880 [Deferrisomatales bacterium]
MSIWFRRALLRLLLYPHRLLPTALRRNRDRPAFGDGLPYGRVAERVGALGAHWRGQGVAPGDRVVVDLPNDPAFVEARLAAILAGAVAVPVPPGSDDRRLGWIAEVTEARAYLGPRPEAVPGLAAVPLDPLAGDREAYEGIVAAGTPGGRPARVGGNDLVTINFTSGTTGEPKGVMSTAAGWGWSLYYALGENRVPVGGDEVFLHAIPLATAGSTLILPAVLSGARSLFLPLWDADRAAETVEREGVTRIFLTPTQLAEFVDAVRAGGRDVSSLKSVIYGTEGIPRARIRKALDVLGPVLQQGYGMAEALPPVCLLHPDEHAAAAAAGDDEVLGSAGRPTRAVTLRVCDEEGRALGPGEAGSIRLAGRTLSPGYWKRPDLTAASRRGGLYVTGDVGCLDRRGYLHVEGRAGRVPSPGARRAVEWAEARPEVCLAWAEEAPGRILLTAVAARGREPDLEALAAGAAGAAADARPVEVRLLPQAPKTPSCKLRLPAEPLPSSPGAEEPKKSRVP